MIRLENLRRVKNLIYGDFILGDDLTVGHFVYDCDAREYISAEYGEFNPLEDFVYGFDHAEELLIKMIESGKFYEKTRTYWC